MLEAQGRESNSHWRGWEASPLRRGRKETWVCFLGSENKPEWRERKLTPDLGKLFRQNLLNAIKTDTGNFLQISEGSCHRRKEQGSCYMGEICHYYKNWLSGLFPFGGLTGHCCPSCCSLSLFSPGSCYPSSFSSFSWSPPFCRRL